MGTETDRIELEGYIFVPAAREVAPEQRPEMQFITGEVPVEEQGRALVYDSNGNHISDPELGAAMVVEKDGQPTHYVKVGQSGIEKGQLYNPVAVLSHSLDLSIADERRGSKKYEYRGVNSNVFDLYTHFLKTKEQRFLRAAQAEVLDNG